MILQKIVRETKIQKITVTFCWIFFITSEFFHDTGQLGAVQGRLQL